MDQILSFASFDEIPITYLNELANLTEELGLLNDHAWALKSRASSLLSSQHPCEALIVYEDALMLYPNNIDLQANRANFIRRIAVMTATMAEQDFRNPEIARVYDRLVDLGEVPINLHFSMIHVYRFNGAIEKATDLALKLHAAAPNYFGLADSLSLLAERSENPRLQSLALKLNNS